MKKTDKTLVFAILSTLLMILYAQFVLGHFSRCFMLENQLNSLGLSFSYSKEQVMDFFDSRNREQLLCYRNFIGIWDMIFPLLYTLMYMSWIRYFFRKPVWLLMIPLIRMFTDWTENSIEISMLDIYMNKAEIDSGIIAWGSAVTSFKWLLSVIVYGIFAVGFAKIAYSTFFRRFGKNRGKLSKA